MFMADETTPKHPDGGKKDTTSYSATKAPETQAEMGGRDSTGDPRLIRFGAILRAAGLDELSQIINVVRGEMSLVGPRPCLRYEFDLYRPWQRERFNTLPGLTGLWQGQ